MFQFAPLLGRFAKDESGVFAVLFGLMAIVLIALGGATVDYVSLEQTRQRAQVALDAAALALQPEIYLPGMTSESIRSRAEAIVLERIGDINLINAEVDGIEIDLEAGRLLLSGRLTVPTIFVSLVGVTQLDYLIDAIVQDTQTPNYSKMALIPYAQAVNVGSYATALRGPIRAARDVSNIAWTTGTTKSITNVSSHSTARITSASHGSAA
jgi:hypothetical protein